VKLPNFFPTKSKHSSRNSNNFIILDITSTSAKALFVTKSMDDMLKVKGISTRDSQNAPLRSEALKSVVTECFDQTGSEADEVIVGLSGPKVMGFILIAKSERENSEEPISPKEMDRLYDKIRSSAYAQAKQRWEMFFAESVDFEPLDVVITSIHVDENQVDAAEGLTGSNIQITVYCSYAEKEYYRWVTKILDELKFSTVTVTTTVYSQSKLLAEKEKNFLLIDIGKDHTDVAVIFGKNIIQTRSFELGGSYFTEHLMDRTGLDRVHANSKKEAYSAETLSEDEVEKISDYIYEAGKDWRVALNTALSSITGVKSFPKSIYLTGGSAAMPVIEELLYEEDWKKSLPFAGELEVHKTSKDSWQSYLSDDLSILNGQRMFPPASLAVIKLELESQNE
jgi:cell division ATPase FtsA